MIFFKSLFNITLSFTAPIKFPYAILLSPFVLHVRPYHPPWLDHHNIWWEHQLHRKEDKSIRLSGCLPTYLPTYLPLWSAVVNVQLPLIRHHAMQTYGVWRWASPVPIVQETGSGGCGTENILFFLRRIRPRFSGHPFRSLVTILTELPRLLVYVCSYMT
jgi:hypothetical protein